MFLHSLNTFMVSYWTWEVWFNQISYSSPLYWYVATWKQLSFVLILRNFNPGNISELLFHILVLVAMCRKPTVPRVNNIISLQNHLVTCTDYKNFLSFYISYLYHFVSHCLPQSKLTQDDTIICSHSV